MTKCIEQFLLSRIMQQAKELDLEIIAKDASITSYLQVKLENSTVISGLIIEDDALAK